MRDSWWTGLLPVSLRRHFVGRSTLQRIVGNTGWLFFDKLMRMGVGLVVGVWVARYLGPAQFGLLNYATAYVALFGAAASLGLQEIVVRDLVKEPQNAEETLSTAFVLQLCGGLLALGLAVIMIMCMRRNDVLAWGMVAIIGSTMVMKATDVIKYWFEAKVQSKPVVIVENIIFLVLSAAKVGMILLGASLLAFVWLTLVEAMLMAGGLICIYWRYLEGKIRWSVHIARARHLLSESWPLILSGLSVMFYMRIDQIMLGEMLGDDAVGIYSAAVRISEIWYFVPIAIVASVFPTLVESKKISEDLYNKRMQQLYDATTLIAIAVIIPVTIFGSEIATLLYGREYQAAGMVLTVHVWSSLFVFFGVASNKWFVLEGLQFIAFMRTLYGLLVNVIANLFLIPKYGAVGAAYATIISYAMASFIFDLTKRETRQMFIMKARSLNVVRVLSSSIESIRR